MSVITQSGSKRCHILGVSPMRWTLLLRGKASGSAISAKRTARRTVLLAVVYVSIEMRWIARSEVNIHRRKTCFRIFRG